MGGEVGGLRRNRELVLVIGKCNGSSERVRSGFLEERERGGEGLTSYSSCPLRKV